MNYNLLLSYALSIILLLATPGPVTLFVINHSLKSGFKSAFKAIIGTNSASLILIFISFIIIQGVFSISEQALLWLTLLGSLYLIYFAISILKDNINLTEQSIKPTNSQNPMRDGFLIGISNPKDILFFIGFFPIFLDLHHSLPIAMALLLLVWVILDYTLLSCYALMFSKIRHNRLANIISKTSGTVLLLLAIYALYKTALALFFQ